MSNMFKKTDRNFDLKQVLVWIGLAALEGYFSVTSFLRHDYIFGSIFALLTVMFLVAAYTLYKKNGK